LRIGMQTARGLAAAHAQGLVHRDIKPANILLEDGVERLTITDFGLARAADDASLTRSGVIAGTPQFMSPEQARGDAVDARSDLFSLGSVLYALCTGRAPFRAETSFGVLRRITDDTPRPIREINPETPEWLAAAIERLHAKEPAKRYGSAEDVARIFEQCLAHMQQPSAVPLPESLRNRPVMPIGHRRRAVSWLAGASATCVVIAGIAYVLHDRSGDEIRDRDAATANGLTAGLGNRDDVAPSAANRWNDGVSAEISELKEDVDEFNAAASQLWEETDNAAQ
jgi:serine/threonine protein kinase